MKKVTIFIIHCFLCLTVIAQKKDIQGFENFKKVLPYMIKGLSKETPKNFSDNTSGKFYKPWDIEKLSLDEIKNITEKLEKNKRFRVRKEYTGIWKLSFFSKLKNYESIKAIYEADGRLSNVFVTIDSINALDEKGSSIIIKNEGSIKNNEGTTLTFNSGQVTTTFPVKKEYEKITGSIQISLHEYANFYHQSFSKKDTKSFNLGNNKGLKILKIVKNKAYIEVPTKIENLEIVSVNKKGERFSSNTKTFLPKKVYDFVEQGKTNEEEVNNFIKNLKYEDVYSGSKIIIYEANGIIKNLYLYIKSTPKKLNTQNIVISLDKW